MAHIKFMADKPRSLPWRAHVNRKGHKPLVKMHPTKQEAEVWASEQERSIRLNGLPLTIDQLKNVFVKDIVSRYLLEKTPFKRTTSEKSVLTRFRDSDLGRKSLAAISKVDAYGYVNQRFKKVERSTVRRDVNSIQHVFEVAKEEWGYTNLTNPFRIKLKNTKKIRKREVKPEELRALLRSARTGCFGLNKLYVPLLIYLIAKTCLREEELCSLTWKDVDLDKRVSCAQNSSPTR